MRSSLAVALLLAACNSGDRTPRSAECGPDDPCALGTCVDGACVLPVAPDTVLEVTPPAMTNQPTSEFMFRADGDATSFRCSLDGAPATPCSPPFLITVGDGEHVLVVTAIGPGGEDASPATFTWTVDLTPPETIIGAGPEGAVNSREASFSLTSTEPAEYLCALDGAGLAACPASFTELAEGEHVILVAARDLAGNVDPTPAERRWVVDVTPPIAAFALVPSDPTNAVWAELRFAATEDGLRWIHRLDDGPEVESTVPDATLEVTAGAHTLSLWAVDLAGNRSVAPAVHAWTVDTANPDTLVDTRPPARTRQTSAAFTFRSSKPAGATFRCRLDGGAYVPCDSGAVTYPGPLAAGAHSFDVYARDPSGNQDPAPARAEWTIDLTPPAMAIQSPTQGATTGPAVQVAYTKGDAVECSVDGAAWGACPASPHARSFGNGARSITIRGRDDVGNEGQARVDFTVDAVGPTVTITSPGGTTGRSPTLTYSKGDAAQCRVNGGAWAACPASGSALGPYGSGPQSHSIQGRDPLGNEGNVATAAFTVDADPPVVSISAPASGATTGPSPALIYAKGDASECRVNGGGWGACPVSGALLGPYATGPQTYSIQGRDGLGNESALVSVSFTADATGPTIAISSPAGTTGPSPSLTYTRGDAIECQVNGGAWSACPANGALLGPYPSGHQTYSLRGRDGFGNPGNIATASFTVDATGPTVTITSPGGTTGPSPTLAYSKGDATECRVNGGAFGACPANGAALGPFASGPQTYSVQGRDSFGNVGNLASASFTVDADPPSLSIAAPASGATTGPSPALIYAKGDATACSVNGGAFGACPTSGAPLGPYPTGSATYRIAARDSVGNSVERSVTFTVDATAPQLTITAPAAGAFVRGPSVTFTFTMNADVDRCTLDGVAFDPCPATHTKTYAAGAATFTAVAHDAVGNTTTVSRTFTVDLTPPVVDVICVDEIAYGEGIRFTASDPSGVTATCYVDGAATDCGNGNVVPRGIYIGASHFLEVVVVDGAGRQTIDSCEFILDNGDGHAVFIGYDFVQSHASMNAILRNALRLARIEPGTSEIRVTTLRGAGQFLDPAEDNALSALLTGTFRALPTRADDLDDTIEKLRESHVLLVYDQNGGQDTLLADSVFKEEVQTFRGRGGVVIVLDGLTGGGGLSTTFRLMGNQGFGFILLQDAGTASNQTNANVVQAGDPTMAGITAFPPPFHTVAAFPTNLPSKVLEQHGAGIVFHATGP